MKILLMVLLFSAIVFSQTYFEIEPRIAFEDTVTWVSFNDQITVNLGLGSADWVMYGYELTYFNPDSIGKFRHFKRLITKRVQVSYSGQAITQTAQKNATAAKFELIYTGITQ